MKTRLPAATALARVLLAAAGGLAALSLATPGFAQQGAPIPPRQDARSPTGVSYASGTFTYEARDLSIGGEFPQGLTLDRTYINNVGVGHLGAHGWTHNFSGGIISYSVPHPMGEEWPENEEPYIYNVSVGGRSVGFRRISGPIPAGSPVGTYEPITPSGASLVYTGTTLGNGRYIFTDGDGSVINFPLGYQPPGIQDWTAPDGTRLEFGYDPVTIVLRSVISNRGYAILFEPATSGQRKVCAVNMTQHAITPTSLCPAGVQSVTYAYANGAFSPSVPVLAGFTDASGQTTTYGYVNPNRLGCITLPGQSSCQIQNSYTICYEYNPNNGQNEYRNERVTSQTTATGESYAYSYQFDPGDPPKCTPRYEVETTMTVNGTAVTHATTNSANMPQSIVDPLGRTSSFLWNMGGGIENEPAQLGRVTHPLGNSIINSYDARGNLVSQLVRAVPGSGLPDLETMSVYPSTCANIKTCNKPTSVTDARDNVTDYTYDPAHGGVLTETGPAVSGVRPQTRHEYAQRHAWISNGAGSYVQAATPVWVRTATSLCRTSAATGNPAAPCATAGDEVRTSYDYGPNSGPNNLLLRGQALTSIDGGVTTTLRTCYGYDRDGRRVSETQPNANLGSCP